MTPSIINIVKSSDFSSRIDIVLNARNNCGAVYCWVMVVYRNEEIAACFEELDKDGNGVLSPEEVVSVIAERLGFDDAMARYLVEMFDQNQDGSLDKTEFMQLWMSMFGP